MFFLMSSIFCRFSLHRKADEKQMCAVRPISMYREIHFNAARKKRNNSRWRLYRYFRLYRNKQHRTIDIYYTRVFSLLVSESFGVILDHTASRQFQCNDFSSIWRHTTKFRVRSKYQRSMDILHCGKQWIFVWVLVRFMTNLSPLVQSSFETFVYIMYIRDTF